MCGKAANPKLIRFGIGGLCSLRPAKNARATRTLVGFSALVSDFTPPHHSEFVEGEPAEPAIRSFRVSPVNHLLTTRLDAHKLQDGKSCPTSVLTHPVALPVQNYPSRTSTRLNDRPLPNDPDLESKTTRAAAYHHVTVYRQG